jgi:hypothetical protein
MRFPGCRAVSAYAPVRPGVDGHREAARVYPRLHGREAVRRLPGVRLVGTRGSAGIEYGEVELSASQQSGRRSGSVRTERRARLGEDQHAAARGDGELVRAMRQRGPAARQGSGGQDAHARVVAELLPQRSTSLRWAAVIEHDHVKVVDSALIERRTHGGDSGLGLVSHRQKH